eukprot:TRINITY_DN33072_c0_g1_i1.p1 TRINITY_DN33072_c0_g1~~TRINITY_DN33072_c0_g1_i1.p1  ORF type:complete len:113 (+),score=22.01 TRINITY_DN33072_c0_g1_i1:241-579(+)
MSNWIVNIIKKNAQETLGLIPTEHHRTAMQFLQNYGHELSGQLTSAKLPNTVNPMSINKDLENFERDIDNAVLQNEFLKDVVDDVDHSKIVSGSAKEEHLEMMNEYPATSSI